MDRISSSDNLSVIIGYCPIKRWILIDLLYLKAWRVVANNPRELLNYFNKLKGIMIQNKHLFQVTQNKLKELERGLVELLKIKETLRPRQFSARKNSLCGMIETLKQEIAEVGQS